MKKLIVIAASLAALTAIVWGAQAVATPSTNQGLATRVRQLETKVTVLKRRVTNLEVKEACIHTFVGVSRNGSSDPTGYGYHFQDPLRGDILTTALDLTPSYASPHYRLALVDQSCSWKAGP